jgi:hypothetical protein
MTLHLFDKPDRGPSIDELLEGFWGGKDPSLNRPEIGLQFVWIGEAVFLAENGDDAFHIEVFCSKEAALWAYWNDQLDIAYECQDDSDFNATEHLAGVLSAIQQLRDDGEFHDGDTVIRIREEKIN